MAILEAVVYTVYGAVVCVLSVEQLKKFHLWQILLMLHRQTEMLAAVSHEPCGMWTNESVNVIYWHQGFHRYVCYLVPWKPTSTHRSPTACRSIITVHCTAWPYYLLYPCCGSCVWCGSFLFPFVSEQRAAVKQFPFWIKVLWILNAFWICE